LNETDKLEGFLHDIIKGDYYLPQLCQH